MTATNDNEVDEAARPVDSAAPVRTNVPTIVAAIAALGLVPAIFGFAQARSELQFEREKVSRLEETQQARLKFTYLLLPAPTSLASKPVDDAARDRDRVLSEALGDYTVVLPRSDQTDIAADPTDPTVRQSISCHSTPCKRVATGEAQPDTLFLYLLVQNDGAGRASDLRMVFASASPKLAEFNEFASAFTPSAVGTAESERLGDLAAGKGLLLPLARLAVVNKEQYPLGLVALGPTRVPKSASFTGNEGSHPRDVEVRQPADGIILIRATEPIQTGG